MQRMAASVGQNVALAWVSVTFLQALIRLVKPRFMKSLHAQRLAARGTSKLPKPLRVKLFVNCQKARAPTALRAYAR